MVVVVTPIDLAPAPENELRQQRHPDCFACAPRHPFGLKLTFSRSEGAGVQATFPCGWFFQGFPGKLHGGIVSTLLDSAMVQALMADGIEAVTADLQVKFLLPVELGREAKVTGECQRHKGRIHYMTANLTQGDKVRATARARFFETRMAR